MRILTIIVLLGGLLLAVSSRQVAAGATSGSWACSTDDTASGCATTSIPPIPTNRLNLAAAAVGQDGKLYAFGGGADMRAVDVYDPTANTWTSRGPMPQGDIAQGAVTDANGLIYLIGGTYHGTAVEAYDPATDSWAQEAPLPSFLQGPAVTSTPDGTIYVFGGADSGADPVNTVYAYSPATDTWTTKTPMDVKRTGAAAVLAHNGLIYVMGGSTDSPLGAIDTVQVYDPAIDAWHDPSWPSWRWKDYAPMPMARLFFGASVTPDGTIYVAGGGETGTDTNLTQVDAFNPVLNTWRTVNAIPSPRSSTTRAADPSGRIYILGGFGPPTGSGGFKDDSRMVEVYTPGTLDWPSPTATSVPDTPTVTLTVVRPTPIPLTLTVQTSGTVRAGALSVNVRTAPRARLTFDLMAKQRGRVAFHATIYEQASTTGSFRGTLHLHYRHAGKVAGLLTVTARGSRGTKVKRVSLTFLPQR